MTAEFPFMMALFTGTDCAAPVYTYILGGVNETWTPSAAVPLGSAVGFLAANQSFSGYSAEGTYVMSVCGIGYCCPLPGA